MSHVWVTQGRFKEAEEESRRALECDPLNFGIVAHQVWVKYVQGRFPRPSAPERRVCGWGHRMAR